MAKVYMDQIQKSQLLLAGLKRNATRLKDKDLDEAFITQFENEITAEVIINEQYDKLKTDFKAKTIEANRKLLEIKQQQKTAKKVIKNNFDKSEWPLFGIPDKR